MPTISTMSFKNESFSSSSPLLEPLTQMGTSISALQVPKKEQMGVSCSLKRKRPPKIQIPNVLRGIKIDNQFVNFMGSPVGDEIVSSFGDIGVGVCSVKGKKKFMEDTHKIVSSIDGNPKKGFFGVYDGHGGKKAAEFVAESLHKNIIDMLKNCGESMTKEEVVEAAYLKTDKEFLEQGVGSGACCVTVSIDETEIIVSNLGDCRAVLCRGGVAEALTNDHRAEREDERQRIEDKGGYVEFHKGSWRVHGILSVSRSIGDAHLKDWVVANPDTKILDLTPDMDFLVVASDGLWDEVGHQEAIDIVLQFHSAENKTVRSRDDLLLSDNEKLKHIKEVDDEYLCINTSPSPKMKRVSLVKQQKWTKLSPSNRKTIGIGNLKEGSCDIDSENESPPAKVRRIPLFQQKNMKIQSPSQENERPISCGLIAACKELVNLAVTRGSMDDITVMIIDLKHFKGINT